MKTFWLEASCEGATLKTLVKSHMVDEMVTLWTEQLAKLPADEDHRSASRDVVVSAMTTGKHHTDQTTAEMVCYALLWLTATGPIGEKALPFMRRGDMTVIHEITRQQGQQYRFRTRFDEKTDALLAL